MKVSILQIVEMGERHENIDENYTLDGMEVDKLIVAGRVENIA